MHNHSSDTPVLSTLIFTKYSRQPPAATSQGYDGKTSKKPRSVVRTRRWTTSAGTDPTTSFLTAAIILCTLRAGITAAAGTRLALSKILVKGFKLYPFR